MAGITMVVYLWATIMTAYGDQFTDAAQTGTDEANRLIDGYTDPSFNNGTIQFSDGESVDVTDLFPGSSSSNTEPEGTYLPAGYSSSVTDLESLYGDDSAAGTEGATNKTTLYDDAGSSDPSTQGTAYSILTETMSMPRPDMTNDPVFNQSKEIFANIDDVTDSFADCSNDSELDVFTRTVHVPDYKNCNRVSDYSGTRTVEHEYAAGVISHHSGPANIDNCGPGCINAWIGTVGNNYWTGRCKIYEEFTRYRIDKPEAITKVVMDLARFDDYMQVYIDDTKIYNGPNNLFPPETEGPCELSTSWKRTPNIDVTQYFTNVEPGTVLEFKIRVSVYKGGEGYARLALNYDSSEALTDNGWTPEDGLNAIKAINDGFWDGDITCTASPTVVDGCATINGIRVCESDFPTPSPIPGISNFCKKVSVNGGSGFYEGQMDCWTDIAGEVHCPYNNGGNLDSCGQYEANPQCGFISSECVDGAQGSSGLCYNTKETWDCGTDTAINDATLTQNISCDGPVRCSGLECVDPAFSSSQTFSKAASLLEAASMMGNDLDCAGETIEENRECDVFTGEAQECKIAVGGLQDCCETPDGVSIVDYIQTMMTLKRADSALMAAEFAKGSTQKALQSSYKELTGPVRDAVAHVGEPFVTAIDAVSAAVDQVQDAFIEKVNEWAAEVFSEEVLMEAGLEAGAGFAAEGTVLGNAATGLQFIGTVYMYYQIAMVLIQIIWQCEEEELQLGVHRELKNCSYVGSYCKTEILGTCIEERESYCCFNSPLSRILQEQVRPQLGLTFGTPKSPICTGIPVERMEDVDWDLVNLDEWIALLNISGMYPNPETLTLDAVTGSGSTLNLDGTRMNSLDRTLERLDGIPVDELRMEAQKDLPDPS